MSIKHLLINFAIKKPGKYHLNQLIHANMTSNGTNQQHVPLDAMQWELPWARACLVRLFIPAVPCGGAAPVSWELCARHAPRSTGHISSQLILTVTVGSGNETTFPRSYDQQEAAVGHNPLLCPPPSWAGSLRHSINVKPCPSCNSRRFLTIAPKRNCTLVLPLINIRGRKGAAYRVCRMHFQLWPSYVQYLTHTLVGSPPPPTLDRTVVYKLLLAADFFFPSKLFHKTSIYDSPIIGNSQNV